MLTPLEHLRQSEQFAVWATDWYQTGKTEDQPLAQSAAAIGRLHAYLALAVNDLRGSGAPEPEHRASVEGFAPAAPVDPDLSRRVPVNELMPDDEHVQLAGETWMDSEQEHRVECACGEVFGAPNLDVAEAALAAHISRVTGRAVPQ